ncbi:FtsW/RodA/SpoVE family cell cycle protein [Candidatus Avelusimicrobium faecicola]|uniref:FtsW/RodA/SpoVE family cell cycle protein n=1 Tax=Candidatus Avelusimicrobium faecicola TaxID=3416205 RepID=UPI002A600626|nr:putative lipid II flippase FtsW [Spirochaetota bacterium]MDE3277074.1 putative peptidoglycan glycosyltransferase FtsW [Spirochaetota bacterium]MDY2940469.1 putative peptidoglycan glycosyltransferase FtsW [Elusimicrobiaceae bacterium]MDY6128505.1 putative peptidoglycan glycosyltransferase FtsW [Elusimicrobiaceae bacterium]
MRTLFSRPARRNNFIRPKNTSRFAEPGKRGAWRFLPLDKTLAIITASFVVFGLVFTYSSSAFDSTSFFKRQLVFDIIGLIAAVVLWQFYDRLQKIKLFRPIYLIYGTWVLLVIVLFTKPIANVHRWIDLGFFNLQPSEIAKVTLLIYVADYLSTVQGKLSKNWGLLVRPLFVTGVTLGLILVAKDIGTPFLMACVVGAMLFVSGARLKQLGAVCLAVLPIVLHQLFFVKYRRDRILSFLHPESDPGNNGYQLIRSFTAVGSGGWLGKGLGNSELKLEYLPAAHTDFIFSIICEEIGLIGATLVVVFFCALLTRGISLARVARNNFNSLLIFGLTLTISGQAFFNMAMAIGLLPTKGIAMPFFSYGGSSVIMTLAMMGIIMNMTASDSAPKTQSGPDYTQFKTRNR